MRINLQQALAKYIQEFLNKAGEINVDEKLTSEQRTKNTKDEYEKLQELLKAFSDNFTQNIFTPGTNYFYSPVKGFNDARQTLDIITITLSTSTVGQKLNNIINENLRQAFFRYLSGRKTR